MREIYPCHRQFREPELVFNLLDRYAPIQLGLSAISPLSYSYNLFSPAGEYSVSGSVLARNPLLIIQK